MNIRFPYGVIEALITRWTSVLFARHGLPYRRHDFFVSKVFLDPRSALILKQSKQSSPLSLAFPLYPLPLYSRFPSLVFTFIRVTVFICRSRTETVRFVVALIFHILLHLRYSKRGSEIFTLFLSYASFARRTRNRSILYAKPKHSQNTSRKHSFLLRFRLRNK